MKEVKELEPRRRASDDRPEVRLELTRDGVERVLSLYGEDARGSPGVQHEAPFGRSRLFYALRRYWWLVLVLGVAGGGLSAVLSDRITPLYRVSAQAVLAYRSLDNDANTSSPGFGSASFIATQAEILRSPNIVSAALSRISPGEVSLPQIAAMLEAVTAAPISGTQVIALGYIGPDAPLGAKLLTAMVEIYRDGLRSAEEDLQQHRLQAKAHELAALSEELAGIDDSLAQLREKLAVAGSIDAAVEFERRKGERAAEQLREARRAQVTVMTRPAPAARLDPGGEAELRHLAEKLGEAEANLERARRNLRPAHPNLASAEREVELLREQVTRSRQRQSAAASAPGARGDALMRLEDRLQETQSGTADRLAELERALVDERRVLEDQTRLSLLIAGLRREVADQEFALQLTRSGDLGVTASLISSPLLPADPFWPKLTLMVPLGAIAGAGLGLLLALQASRRRPEAVVQAS